LREEIADTAGLGLYTTLAMTFDEPRISSINYLDPEAVYNLIVRDLCGEKYHRLFNDTDRVHLSEFLGLTAQEGLTYERFNELLLLLEQDRVSEPFYQFFFSRTGELKLSELAQCVIRFRGYAMLCYGDFRFAYKYLSTKAETELLRCLHPFCGDAEKIKARYAGRPKGTLRIDRIPKEKTWCLGYIAGIKSDKESKRVVELLQGSPRDGEIRKVAESYRALGEEIGNARAKGIRNTDVYLTWDFMDVYVATSMRKRWEFEDVAEFVISLFSDERLRALNLRYFDPTQSDCRSRIDKGLVEALMLKRASCTVYLVQESDTLGKDSELASTLAQGKPVIAFVPTLDVEAYSSKIKAFPLEFFKIRFRVLEAEGVFDEPDLRQQLSEADPKFVDVVNDFLNELKTFVDQQPLTLWEIKQNEFKKGTINFELVCRMLAIAEKYNFDKRAAVLRSVHPLSLQVHLESGVANGVLVARSTQECAEILHSLLTNSLSFSIERDDKSKCTLLRERISQSPFRAVTEYEKLANSFWNFYLVAEHRKGEEGAE
jgi:hypothetical protein